MSSASLKYCLSPPLAMQFTHFPTHLGSLQWLHFHGELLQVQVVRHVAVYSLADASRGLGPVLFAPFGVVLFFGFGRVLYQGQFLLRRLRVNGRGYRFLRHQPLRLDRIVVEAAPFLERVPRNLVVRLGVPAQHGGVVIQPDTAAERLDHGSGLLEHLVRVDDADLRAGLVARAQPADNGLRLLVVGELVGVLFARGDVRADQALGAQVVEDAAHLVVPGFEGVVGVEAGDFVQGRDGAAEVGGHAEVRVADEEGEVEARQELLGHHGGIAGLGLRVVRVGLAGPGLGVTVLSGLVLAVAALFGVAVGHASFVTGGLSIGAYAAFDPLE